jgi:hypothetical protein
VALRRTETLLSRAMASKFLVLVLASAAACSSAKATVQWSHVEAVAPVDNVAVFSTVQDNAFTGVVKGFVFVGFEKRMRAGFAACGIRSEFRRGSPQEQSITTLTVVRSGSDHLIRTNRQNEMRTDGEVSFKLELFDARANRVTWRAVVDFEWKSDATVADGELLADAVLSRLRSDGMVACAKR